MIIPGESSLDHVPIWIQSAVRLGAKFLRVAASSLPITAAYASPGTALPCCQCKKEHPPVMDEYYFWLEDARWFDPADAPAPQNADLHINTPGINPPLRARVRRSIREREMLIQPLIGTHQRRR